MASVPATNGAAGENGPINMLNSDIKYDKNNDENYKKLKEDKKRLKKELLIKDSEINSLKKILEEKDKSTKVNYIPLNEARKITYKALVKGSAAQKFIHLIESNSINFKLKKKAINQLVLNAFGDMHHQKNRYPEILKYTDSHFKLFRQEQLILLAENERLTLQMKELKKQLLDNKIEYFKRNEKNLISTMKRSAIDKGKKTSSCNYTGDDNYVELDADIVEKNFINLIKNFKIAQLKLLFYAFRKLSNNLYYNSDAVNINASFISSLKRGVEILNNILKYKKIVIISNSFYKLLSYNDSNFLYNNNRKYSYLTNINHYTKNDYTYENIKKKKKKKSHGISNFVFKPYYYDNLPSATYDVKNKRCTLNKLKKNCIIRDILSNDDAVDETIYDPFFFQNKILNNSTATTNAYHKIYKNSYFDLGLDKNNDNSEKRSYYSDLDYFGEFSTYDKEKFIDMFISETSRR
ncbi:conserved Plasmodium protein, unknown function [Plasmodium malariae]|uniref:Uncharacterized protein n=1 Tax=Plasmodium malariae TaxID=5858 RepID=A0A1C3L1L4_PLAMA|nr:conserved Plasmodium protein, unknown function [Plasmodium malariae]